MDRCALWLKGYLERIGLSARLIQTDGPPIVFGEFIPDVKGPVKTLLIYQHYDVQPVEPLQEWKSDPFQARMVDDLIYARGAQDNKGQCFYTLLAIEAYLQLATSKKLHLKVMVEGEEEIGSASTMKAIDRDPEPFKADHLLVIDVGLEKRDHPAVTVGTRGIITQEVIFNNGSFDLHSGIHGGIAYNPNRALIETLSKIWNRDGTVAIDHFYEGIELLTEAEKQMLSLEFDEREYRENNGVKVLSCDTENVMDANWLLPTLEINGIEGGSSGLGFKTIIPAEAKAKISTRIAAGQDPLRIMEAIERYIKRSAPDGFDVVVKNLSGSQGYRAAFDSELIAITKEAYQSVLQRPCQMILCGASIPIIHYLAEVSGGEAILMGYGLNEDQIHAPNEHFDLRRILQGFLTVAQICLLYDDN